MHADAIMKLLAQGREEKAERKSVILNNPTKYYCRDTVYTVRPFLHV